jgi:hypothetical protein
VEWDGLTLLREPTALEALCIKAIDRVMESGKQQITPMLDAVRRRWFEEIAADYDDGDLDDPEDLQDLQPLILSKDRAELIGALTLLAEQGAQLIVQELVNQGAPPSEPLSDAPRAIIETIAGATLTQLGNDVRSRAVGSAVQAVQLGQPIAARIRQDAASSPSGYVTRAAGQATNVALAQGRAGEMHRRKRQIAFYGYSAVLDAHTCRPCGEADGKSGDTPKDLPSVPNPSCPGGASCRCIIFPVYNVPKPGEAPPEPEPEPEPPTPEPEPTADPTPANEVRALLVKLADEQEAYRVALRDQMKDIEKQRIAARKKRKYKLDAELAQKYGELDKEFRDFLDTKIANQRALLYQEREAVFDVKIDTTLTTDEHRRLERGVEEYKRFVGDGVLPKGAAIEVRAVEAQYAGLGGRAYYKDNGIYFSPGQVDQWKVVHELGHWLEEQNSEIFDEITAFLDRRTAGEAAVKMNDLYVGRGYGDDELTKVDKFENPYVGLQYYHKGKRVASEVLSMGLQYFYEEPAYFAKTDPDFFDLIYNVVHRSKNDED